MVEAEARRQQESDYRLWQKAEGIPVYTGSFVQDLMTVPVAPWPRIGQSGAFVNLADQEQDDGWVIEIAPRGQTAVLHHCFEASYYVLDGRGGALVWQQDKPPETVEWKRGSIFSPPVNCYYQLSVTDNERPARLFAVTNAPMSINLYRNERFVFENPFVFEDRYDGRPGFFQAPAGNVIPRETNFIPDVRSMQLKPTKRGEGAMGSGFTLSNNQAVGHCAEFPPGTYKRAHRHGVGAYVIIVDGQGYSLLWFGDEEKRRVDWTQGTVFSPREGEYHQHFNTGATPTRYLAFRLGRLDTRRPQAGQGWNTEAEIEGIPYDLEAPAIYELYRRECAANGGHVTLPRPSYRDA